MRARALTLQHRACPHSAGICKLCNACMQGLAMRVQGRSHHAIPHCMTDCCGPTAIPGDVRGAMGRAVVPHDAPPARHAPSTP